MEEKLIEAVRNRQVLYDTSHVDYMRTKLKTEKWEEIAKEVDMKTVSDVEAKFLDIPMYAAQSCPLAAQFYPAAALPSGPIPCCRNRSILQQQFNSNRFLFG
ncbi:uncharacterized protein LOC126750316 [Anthonomus grandis grandis]|uniref:uncharacterized protein LOC126750316 n=1 Tax=Anthonomus grandis grandis TaxID=2921223 RepID=UPI0021654CC7|nr:uncharacterized protein LOC126750316 [Anthonomus grandis grandis]